MPIEVQPTLFSLSGERAEIPNITVDANAHRFVNLRDWATLAGPQFREGSIQLFHRGKDLVLGTQIYLTDATHSLSFDEKLTELGKGSSRLEGVWWLPSPKGEVRLVLSNTTDAALSVTAKVQGESPKKEATSSFDLMPHQTRVLDVEADILKREHRAMSRFGAISVEHNGAPGAVLARALALEMDIGYSLPVQFSNPAAAKSQNIQGAGLRIAKVGGEPLSAIAVVHNASQTEMTVSGRVPYTMKDGSSGELYLPQLQLSNGETKVIDVTQLLNVHGVRRDEVASAGLEFQYTGEMGSLITSAFSMSESGNQVFRVPLWDIAAQRSATGGYPWYIEGDSSTLVYIKNVTDQPRQFRLYLMYSSGAYLYPLTTVAPSQTTTIDVRALRDDQVPDVNGKTIPLTETRGQLEWSMTGGEDRVLIGRSEQADLVHGISSSYACINCCGNSFYDGWLTPDGVSVVEGDHRLLIAYQQDANCYGQAYLPYSVGSSFSSFAPSICQSSGGLTTGVGLGETSIQGAWTADSWFMGLKEQCDYTSLEVLREVLCEVLNRPDHVKVLSDIQGVPSTCVSNGIFVRRIKVQIVDVNDFPVTGFFLVSESLTDVSANSCGNGQPPGSSCSPVDPGGQFTDTMAVSDNFCGSGINRNSGCGYTLTSEWSTCLFGGGTLRSIWRYDGETRSNVVRVNGQQGSLEGAFLYGSGGPPTP